MTSRPTLIAAGGRVMKYCGDLFQAHAFIRTLQQTSSMFWIAGCLFLLPKEQELIEQSWDETSNKGDC